MLIPEQFSRLSIDLCLGEYVYVERKGSSDTVSSGDNMGLGAGGCMAEEEYICGSLEVESGAGVGC